MPLIFNAVKYGFCHWVTSRAQLWEKKFFAEASFGLSAIFLLLKGSKFVMKTPHACAILRSLGNTLTNSKRVPTIDH